MTVSPLALAVAAALLAVASAGQFSFSAVISDGMVLQRAPARAAIFGSGASPGAQVDVQLTPTSSSDACTLQADSTKTIAAADGTWKALLKPQKGCPATDSAPATASVTASTGGKTIHSSGVVFGDVYFCSGQSNMELGLHFTLHRNKSYAKILASGGVNNHARNIRLLAFDHNPLPSPAYVVDSSVVSSPWRTAGDALAEGSLDDFSATCYYFGESLLDRLLKAEEGVIIGLIESSYGGTMIESWVEASQQFGCSNITCTSKQTMKFTKKTEQDCFAAGSDVQSHVDRHPEKFPELLDGSGATAKGAGANGQLYNGMVGPFVNYTVKGWLWYQGENNLAFEAGNVLDSQGYACMLPTLINTWRSVWSSVPGTTDPKAPFGIVTLADSTDEGWGANVPQMHWSETANVGYAPNSYLPNTFLATAHDLADPWDDGCMEETSGACCVDTGKKPDARCNLKHRGYLVSTGKFPGVTEPVTPSRGVTIHPRVKKQVGDRLAQAAFSLYYGHPEVPWTGPVLSGCSMGSDGSGKPAIVVRFNSSLLFGEKVQVANYNKTEQASVMWVRVDKEVPEDAAQNHLYGNRAPWWGDDSSWKNVNIQAYGDDGKSILVTDLPESGTITAIRYGHISPKGHPQSGHFKLCCGNRDFKVDPCAPESCPLFTSGPNSLPAMPFHAAFVGGKCKCFAPQTCDESDVFV